MRILGEFKVFSTTRGANRFAGSGYVTSHISLKPFEKTLCGRNVRTMSSRYTSFDDASDCQICAKAYKKQEKK